MHNDRLPNADHVVIGRIENVSVVDRDGNPIAPEPRTTSENVLIKLSACTTHVIRTSLGRFPARFESIYRGATPLDVAAEKKTMLGEEYIFAIKGNNLQVMSHMKFEDRVTSEKDLIRRLKSQPIE